MSAIITFGEVMLRLAPMGYLRLFQNDTLEATFGGGEANVAVSLANYGLSAAFVTKLRRHLLSGKGGIAAAFQSDLRQGAFRHQPGERR